MEHHEFSTFDIVKALKIPRERLKDWMSHGFIKPTTPAEGKGTKAVFTLLDVYCLMLFKQTLTFGIDRKTAAEFIRGFKQQEKSGNKGVSHIFFRFDSKEGERVIRTITIDSGHFAIDIATGRIGPFSREIKFPFVPIAPMSFDENYDGFVVVNYQKIKTEVDRAFSLA